MVKKVVICILLISLFGCKSNKEEEIKANSDNKYDMYESSEMAMLMNEMYNYNLKIKEDILKGKVPTEFPADFLKIHTAELSDFKSRNDRFKTFSTLFINVQKEVFNEKANTTLEERFNNAIGVCISCHQTECTGPIPKIRKLLIK